MLEEIIASLEAAGEKEIPGDVAFRLYDTYGFPIELTKEIAEEHQLEVDEAGFNERMEQQRATARAARAKQGYLGDEKGSAYRELAAKYNVELVGYDQMEMAAQVVSIIRDGQEVESAHQGERVEVVIDKTPFYAEGGGQVADNGTITAKGGAFTVESVSRESQGLIIHHGVVAAGTINVKEEVLATVYREGSDGSGPKPYSHPPAASSFENVLGEHVNQAGSLVAPDRLRFDFTHPWGLTADGFGLG